MSDRPILFSAPMVRALLAGRKTQTRRIIKPQPKLAPHHEPVRVESRGGGRWVWMVCTDRPAYQFATGDWTSRIQTGDRLWVREAWAPLSALTHNDPGVQALADKGFYRADSGTVEGEISRWRPSIHMPRWASRITLHVTDVRVQRLQEISADDAIAEGIEAGTEDYRLAEWWAAHKDNPPPAEIGAYAMLWERINGKDSWEANPWVAAYTFTVEHANIDSARPTTDE